jgi:hypothetical protein
MSAVTAAVAGGIASAATGALLGGGGGGGGSRQVGTQVTQTSPPAYAAESYKRGIAELKGLQDRGLLGQVQQLSPIERAAIQRGLTFAEQPDPFYDPASLATQQLLGGAQSFLDPASRAYQDLLGAPSSVSQLPTQVSGLLAPTQEQIISKFARGGRLGSGAMGESLGRGMTTAIAPYVQAAQAQDIERQIAGARGLAGVGEVGIRSLGLGVEAAPAVSTIPFTSVDRALGLSGMLSAQDFAESQVPVRAAKEGIDMLSSLTVGKQMSQPLYGADAASSGDIFRAGIAPYVQKGLTAGIGSLFGGGTPDPYTQSVTTGYDFTSSPSPTAGIGIAPIDFSMFGRN